MYPFMNERDYPFDYHTLDPPYLYKEHTTQFNQYTGCDIDLMEINLN